jgi:RimJ/RimL family protein N-acetyltransferase
MTILIGFIRRIPEGTFVRKLEESDSKLCNSLWAYRSLASGPYIRSLILINGGYGLFNSITKELFSFAVINDHFATGMLTTVEAARGRKYGEFVAKFLTVKIAEDLKVTPTVYITSDNVPSINLFQKLGYKKIGDCNWIVVGDEEYW